MITMTKVEKRLEEVTKEYLMDIMKNPTEWKDIKLNTDLFAFEVLGDDYNIIAFSSAYEKLEKKYLNIIGTALNAISSIY